MAPEEIWYISVHPRTRETFNQARHDAYKEAARIIFARQGCVISSDLRTKGGTSLHEKSSGGLAFDGTVEGAGNSAAAIAAERAVGEEIRDNPKLNVLFQEVVAHDLSGNNTGYHIHIAFKADIEDVVAKVKAALRPPKKWQVVTIVKGKVVNRQQYRRLRGAIKAVKTKVRKGKTAKIRKKG